MSGSKKVTPAKKAPPAKKAAPAKKAPRKVSDSLMTAALKAILPSPEPTIHSLKRRGVLKPAAKKPRPPAKPFKIVKPPSARPVPPPESPEFINQSKSIAFQFAERMKARQLEELKKKDPQVSEDVHLKRRPTTRARGANTLKFSDADLADFRKRLMLLRQQASGESSTLKTIALEQNDDRGRDDDDGSDVFLRLQSLGQVDARNKVIQKIDEALRRIDDGSYGICEVCGQLIRKPRLMNMPFVHTCMECQSSMERT